MCALVAVERVGVGIGLGRVHLGVLDLIPLHSERNATAGTVGVPQSRQCYSNT